MTLPFALSLSLSPFPLPVIIPRAPVILLALPPSLPLSLPFFHFSPHSVAAGVGGLEESSVATRIKAEIDDGVEVRAEVSGASGVRFNTLLKKHHEKYHESRICKGDLSKRVNH